MKTLFKFVFEVVFLKIRALNMSLLVYRLVHAPVTRESWVRLPGKEFLKVIG